MSGGLTPTASVYVPKGSTPAGMTSGAPDARGRVPGSPSNDAAAPGGEGLEPDPVLDGAVTEIQGAWSQVCAGSSQQQEAGAVKLVNLLREHGSPLLVRPGLSGGSSLLEAIQSSLESDSGTKPGAASRVRIGALIVVKALAEAVDMQWFEAYGVLLLRGVLSCFKGARVAVTAAEQCARAIIAKMSPTGARSILNAIFDAMKAYEWQVKEGSVGLLVDVTSSDRAREQIQKLLPEIILHLIEALSDTRPAVRNAALAAFPDVCRVVSNTDVTGIIPTIISAYADPSKTEAALEALSGCSFIQVVDAPTLGLILPVLMRGMKERKGLTKRKCALVIGNMCKLVQDPRDAAHFYPMLQPVLQRAVEEVTNEDVRVMCEAALEKLVEVRGAVRDIADAAEEQQRLEPHLEHAMRIVHTHVKGAAMTRLKDLFDYVTALCVGLVEMGVTDASEWSTAVVPFLSSCMSEGEAEAVCSNFMNFCLTGIEAPSSDGGSDEGEDLVNTEFSLGYGGKILLHQTRLWLKRGRRYGILGKNGVGKTSLMRGIASGSLDGLPPDLRTVYVESNPASHLDTPVAEFAVTDPSMPAGTSIQAVRAKLTEYGFPRDLQDAPVSSLSGGWRMKLALAQAMLSNPDLLLLDEPTNHLDVNAVRWLTEYLQKLKHVTVLLVSHSSAFLDNVCTNIIHYNDQKLTTYIGNLSRFVAAHPETKHYFELSSDTLRFTFPTPGRLEGVNSRTQTILKMEGVTFTYPGREKPQLTDVTLRLSRASRVAVVGANGAGKSTLIRLLVGEALPDEGSGEVWKHHSLRIAYVAQHSFVHLEEHMEASPVDYIKWRFSKGVDKEILEKETMQLTEEEKIKLKSTSLGAIQELRNRRTRHGVLEYEVKFVGLPDRDNKYMTKDELEAKGFGQLVKQADERVAAEAAGLDLRPLVTKEIQKHLDDFGLEQEFGTYGKIAGLSGGQKVKLVLASAMWNCPHLLVLDEPTNFLDREALGAFATAIKEFQGGVIMISHDKEFYSALSTETWLVEDGVVEVVEEEMVEGKLVRKKKVKKEEEASDEAKLVNAGANMNKAKEDKAARDFWGKPLSKAELRRRAKEDKRKGK